MVNTPITGLINGMGQVTIAEDELEALRVLARKALAAEPVAAIEKVSKTGPKPKLGDPLSFQEQVIVDRLREAGDHGIHNTDISFTMKGADPLTPASATTQISRIRDKLGHDSVVTVWPTKVNDHGRVVREQSKGVMYVWGGK